MSDTAASTSDSERQISASAPRPQRHKSAPIALMPNASQAATPATSAAATSAASSASRRTLNTAHISTSPLSTTSAAHSTSARPKSVPLMGQSTPTGDDTRPSEPETAARTETIGALVYFSSASENTARFVNSCALGERGINVYRIPLKPGAPALKVREPYVLMVPTYGGGDSRKAVPVQVKRFLNNPANRAWIRGVIASGNTNFGSAYCAAGDIIAAKCHVPFLYHFELMGTREDTRKVRDGLVKFFRERAKA